jgi:hypothetical protein
LEALLAVITVVSFLLAVLSWYQAQRLKDRQATVAAVLSQKVDSTALSLESSFGAVNAIVQIPKGRETSVEEMQDLARLGRSQILQTARILKQSEDLLALWSRGDLQAALMQGAGELKSDPAEEKATTDA